jgi:hypothetical protein
MAKIVDYCPVCGGYYDVCLCADYSAEERAFFEQYERQLEECGLGYSSDASNRNHNHNQ